MTEKNIARQHSATNPFDLLITGKLRGDFGVGTRIRAAAHSALQSISQFTDVPGEQHHG